METHGETRVSQSESPTEPGPATTEANGVSAFDPLLALIVSVWALNISLVKMALTEFPPMAFNVLRLIIASLILLAVLYRTERNFRIARKDLGKILFLSFSGYAVGQALVIQGISMTSAANTAVIFGTSPILIALLSSFFKHDRISPVGWVGVVLGFLGVYIVIRSRAGGFHLSSQTLKGDVVLFLAVCLWVHFSVSARPLVKVYSPLKFSTVTIALGSLLSIPLALPSLKALSLSTISARSWGFLAYAGIISLAAGLIIWFNSVKRVGNTQTSVYSNLQPVLAVIFAHFLLHDPVTGGLAAGALLVFAGIYLTRRGRDAASEVETAPAGDNPS
jgi:drug/metabolite transporter (DMT)-like permease